MLDLQRVHDLELGIGAGEAVLFRGEREVVPGAERLELHPRRPAGRIAAFFTGDPQLRRSGSDGRPGLRRVVRVQSCFLEGVLVVVEHHGRTVERERQHLSRGRRVVAGDSRNVCLGIEFLAGLRHHFVHRLDRLARRHHRRRSDFENLHDVRRIAGTRRGDHGGHRFWIGPLEHRDDLVFLLRLVEAGGKVADPVAQRAGHRMPELDFDLRVRKACRTNDGRSNSRPQQSGNETVHAISSGYGAGNGNVHCGVCSVSLLDDDSKANTRAC